MPSAWFFLLPDGLALFHVALYLCAFKAFLLLEIRARQPLRSWSFPVGVSYAFRTRKPQEHFRTGFISLLYFLIKPVPSHSAKGH